jgi:hypothetical protein
VELEAVEPADRGLAPRGVEGEDAVLSDAGVVTDGQRRRVDEADPRARPELGLQVDGEGKEHTRHELDEAAVAHKPRELVTPILLDLLRVERLEGPLLRLLEADQDRHELARMHPSAPPPPPSCGEEFLLPERLKTLPELVHRAEQVASTHGDTSFQA